MQRIGKGFGFGLPDFPPHIRWQIFGFPLDLVESTDVFQGLGRQFALVGLVQVIELARAWAIQPISVMPLPNPAL
ncbi:Uncharacterised protein [Escherichia coli]|uniref:Uncharacterized protein n=1 Tax=Escherichia coli TaxID=562 RepID=A0A377F687_ECOLX|nr:Uncharacterised protein [Escherichia coli]